MEKPPILKENSLKLLSDFLKKKERRKKDIAYEFVHLSNEKQ